MNNLKVVQRSYLLLNSVKNQYGLSQLNQLSFTANTIIQKRNSSFQSSVDSLTRTHYGIFKTLSESTLVEYIQKFLITVHDTTGLPWWGTIICSTFFLRTAVTLPLAIHQNSVLAKLENVKTELPAIAEELRKETNIAVKMYKWDEKTAKAAFNRSVIDLVNNF